MLEELDRVAELAGGFALWHMESIGLFWLFDVRSGDAYDLNLTSHLILSSCDGRRTLRDILDVLVARFPATSRDELQADLLGLTGAALEAGALVFLPQPQCCGSGIGGERM
jgi:hypothetical protein